MASPYPATSNLTLTSHHSKESLGEKLNAQRKNDEFVDYHFIVHGQRVGAHKAVLALASPYFETMFKSQFLESNAVTLDLSEMFTSTEELEMIVNYMYQPTITLTDDTIVPVLQAASHFLIENLLFLCAEYMRANLGLQNVLRTWALAEMYSLIKLIPLCEALACLRFHDFLITHETALEVPKDFLVRMIQKNVLDATSVGAKVRYLINWTKHNLEERGPLMCEILSQCSSELNLSLDKFHYKDPTSVIKLLEKCENPAAVVKKKSSSRLTARIRRQRSKHNIHTCDMPVCVVTKQEGDYFYSDAHVFMYGFNPERLEWLNLGYFFLRQDERNNMSDIVGFVKGYVVSFVHGFHRRLCLGNLKEETHVVIDPPIQPMKGRKAIGETRVHYLCYDDNVFCVIDQSIKTRKKLASKGKSGGGPLSKTLTAYVRAVFILEKDNKWEHVDDIAIEYDKSREAMSVWSCDDHVTSHEAYVLVTQRFFGFGTSNVCLGRFLTIKKEKNGYKIKALTPPPIDKQSSDHKLSLASTVDNNLVLSIRLAYGRKRSQLPIRVLRYNPSRDAWTDDKYEGIESSPVSHQFEEFKVYKYHALRKPIKNLKNVYTLNMSGPFMSQMWCYHSHLKPEEAWQRLPGPPTTHIYKFMVHNVTHNFINSFTKPAQFEDVAVTAKRSPFFRSDGDQCSIKSDSIEAILPIYPRKVYLSDSEASIQNDVNYYNDESSDDDQVLSNDDYDDSSFSHSSSDGDFF